ASPSSRTRSPVCATGHWTARVRYRWRTTHGGQTQQCLFARLGEVFAPAVGEDVSVVPDRFEPEPPIRDGGAATKVRICQLDQASRMCRHDTQRRPVLRILPSADNLGV